MNALDPQQGGREPHTFFPWTYSKTTLFPHTYSHSYTYSLARSLALSNPNILSQNSESIDTGFSNPIVRSFKQAAQPCPAQTIESSSKVCRFCYLNKQGKKQCFPTSTISLPSSYPSSSTSSPSQTQTPFPNYPTARSKKKNRVLPFPRPLLYPQLPRHRYRKLRAESLRQQQ